MKDILMQAETSDHYTLIRHHSRKSFQMKVTNGTPTQVYHSVVDGVGVRCLVQGSWGFACSTHLDDSLVERATEIAGRSSSQKSHTQEVCPSPRVKGRWTSPIGDMITMDTLEEIMGFLKEADALAAEYKDIGFRHITFLATRDHKEIATSEGSHVQQEEDRVFCTAAVAASAAGKKAVANNAVGGQRGLEFFSQDDLYEMIDEECQRACRLASAGLPPGGKTNVVLSPEVAAVLIHEAVGHVAEADVVQNGSYLAHRLDTLLCSEGVTIIDDGKIPHAFGSYGFDDECISSQETPIISNGCLREYLHCRETAPAAECLTGNARAWIYSKEPSVRMSNTYLQPGNYAMEELYEQVGDGLMLKGITSGLADHSGNFTLHVPEAQRIRGGRLTDTSYSGVAISANAFDVLRELSAIGRQSTFMLIPGICGKSDSAFVGMGSPAIATSVLVGGGLSE
jgi:TldD protein